MIKKNIEELFKRFYKNNPNPKNELNYTNVYTLLIAVVLSAQSTDISVNKVTKNLFNIANTPEKMVSLGINKITDNIQTIGLFKNKGKNIFYLSKRLIDTFNSKIPKNRKDLETLPGVGRKTANVILNLYFKYPTIAVDTHVLRLSNRLKLISSKNTIKIEKKLQKIIPNKYKYNSHLWLILHGRYICKARRPKCFKCFINDLCKSKDKVV